MFRVKLAIIMSNPEFFKVSTQGNLAKRKLGQYVGSPDKGSLLFFPFHGKIPITEVLISP
jgi:hypothetical protein